MDQFEQIDYRDLVDEENKEITAPENEDTKKGIGFLFAKFRALDKKTKAEFLILVCALLATIISLTLFFVSRRAGFDQEEFYAPPAEEGL